MSSPNPPPERFPLVLTQQRVLPLALLCAGAGAIVAHTPWVRLLYAALAALALVAVWLQRRAQPALVIDEHGYAVEERGREKLRVAWAEVQTVKVDPPEHALYVDCGDAARNLLVPPRRGYGFRFERAEALYARLLAAVPADKVEQVERLDLAKAKAHANEDAPPK